jgi:uncharacterized tellurite resistance protein B-like protein
MSLLRFLGLDHPTRSSEAREETASVRRIVDALDRMEPAAARKLARFAYVLGRVARADLEISADETREMERIVAERGRLTEAQAVVVVQIAKSQTLLLGETDGYLVTRAIAADATPDEKAALLDCCFAIAAADRNVSPEEDAELGMIANELGLGRDEFIKARLAHRDAIASLRREPLK